MIFKFALLGALVRVLLANGSPLLCSSIYTVAVAIFAVFSGATIEGIVLGVGISFILSFVYFWLLHRYLETTLAFWSIFVLGIVIGFV